MLNVSALSVKLALIHFAKLKVPMSKTAPCRYHQLSILMHWLMLALFIATYAFIEFRVLFDKGTDPRNSMKLLHFSFGLCIFFLVWLRLILRAIYPAPAITPAPALWQQRSAKLVHVALYLFMVAMPLAGWLLLSAADKTIPFFIWQLPDLIATNKPLAKEIKYWHELIGQIGYGVIGLHALAALAHHYLQKDNTLTRMLPLLTKR